MNAKTSPDINVVSIETTHRHDLSTQQTALVNALVADGTTPDGFSVARINAAVHALLRKRTRAVQQCWPELVPELSTSFNVEFQRYAATHPLPLEFGPLADGHAFIKHLGPSYPKTDELRMTLSSVNLRFRSLHTGLVRRRFPSMKVIWLGESKRLVCALRLFTQQEYWWYSPRLWK